MKVNRQQIKTRDRVSSGKNSRLGIESRKGPRAARIVQIQRMINASPHMAVQRKRIGRMFDRYLQPPIDPVKIEQRLFPPSPSLRSLQAETGQLYSTLKEIGDGEAYNRSLTGALICGITYPNHELYVQDAGRIDSINEGASEGMLNFTAGGTKTFDFGLGGAQYTKVVPEYKEDQGDLKALAVREIMEAVEKLGLDKIPTYDETTVTNIVRVKETFRKLAVQWDFKFGDINTDARRVREEAVGVYRAINEYLDGGDRDQKSILDLLRLFKGSVLEMVVPSVFDETTLMLEKLKGVVDELIVHVGQVSSSDVSKQLRAYLQEQADFSKTDEIMLPRGCDLVAGTVLGRASKETDENVSVINYNLNKLDKPAHHYATRLLSDANDFVTIEGFAKKDYFFFDNTWEFLMHGSRTSFEEAFKDYTDVRYSFFESMEGLDLKGGSVAREGAGTGNIVRNAIGRFRLIQEG